MSQGSYPDHERPCLLPTRREFLWWSAALGASAALPLGWMEAPETLVRLGFIGLGSRGRQALASSLKLPGAEVRALCDLREDVLRSATETRTATGLVTREAGQLFAERSVDAVVLAAPAGAQLELAAAACAAGKDVFLLRPLPLDLRALRSVNDEAARHGRQAQVARATGLALEPGAAGRLVATPGVGLARAEVQARFQTPERPEAKALLAELLDEIDFAQTLLGGRVERSFTVGGPGLLPGRWIDQRIQMELAEKDGARRWLGIHLVAVRGQAVPKVSGVFFQGKRGTAALASSPLLPGDPLDFGLFLNTVRNREVGAGLSLSRLTELAVILNSKEVLS